MDHRLHQIQKLLTQNPNNVPYPINEQYMQAPSREQPPYQPNILETHEKPQHSKASSPKRFWYPR